jgi:hypothetical protein
MGGPPKHFFLTLSHVHSFVWFIWPIMFFSQLEKEKKKKKKKGKFDILISYLLPRSS